MGRHLCRVAPFAVLLALAIAVLALLGRPGAWAAEAGQSLVPVTTAWVELGPDGSFPIYTLTPECIRYRTPEEMEKLREKRERERAEHYGVAYAMLGLKVVAHHDGSLEITWRGGGCKLSGPRR